MQPHILIHKPDPISINLPIFGSIKLWKCCSIHECWQIKTAQIFFLSEYFFFSSKCYFVNVGCLAGLFALVVQPYGRYSHDPRKMYVICGKYNLVFCQMSSYVVRWKTVHLMQIGNLIASVHIAHTNTHTL